MGNYKSYQNIYDGNNKKVGYDHHSHIPSSHINPIWNIRSKVEALLAKPAKCFQNSLPESTSWDVPNNLIWSDLIPIPMWNNHRVPWMMSYFEASADSKPLIWSLKCLLFQKKHHPQRWIHHANTGLVGTYIGISPAWLQYSSPVLKKMPPADPWATRSVGKWGRSEAKF